MAEEFPKVWTPRKHQKKGTRWLVQRPEATAWMEPGLGKTSVALAAFKAMMAAGVSEKMLVVAPLRVCYMVWTNNPDVEGELWKWKNFHDLSISLIHGPSKEEAFEADANIYVTNYATLRWLCSNEGRGKTTRIARLIKRGCKMLCIDEINKFKHTQSKRFKQFYPFAGRFSRRWGLTGSPVANGYIDLFGQVKLIDRGKRLGQYKYQYKNEYFLPSGYMGKVPKLMDGAEKKIQKRLSDFAISMKATDHLDMPDLVEQPLYVNLSKKVMKAYEVLEEEFITLLEDGVVTAANGGVASQKCRQVASGGVYKDNEPGEISKAGRKNREWHDLHDEKTDALFDLLDELQGTPLLVGIQFRHDLDRINRAYRKRYKKDVPAIVGGTTAKRTATVLGAWNRGELPMLVGHPAAMGHGLNMQKVSAHIAWYSLPWDYDHYDQFVRRVWRQGQKGSRTMVHRFIARDTIDEYVTKKLTKKKRVQEDLLDAIKAIKARRQRR